MCVKCVLSVCVYCPCYCSWCEAHGHWGSAGGCPEWALLHSELPAEGKQREDILCNILSCMALLYIIYGIITTCIRTVNVYCSIVRISLLIMPVLSECCVCFSSLFLVKCMYGYTSIHMYMYSYVYTMICSSCGLFSSQRVSFP